MPSALSAFILATVSLILSISWLSVSSIFRSAGLIPVVEMACRTCSTKSGWRNSSALALRASCRLLVAGLPDQSLIWAHAVCSTHNPIGTIRPVFSASGINCSGRIKPRSGCIQRSNASAPMARRSLFTCIW